MKEYEISMKIRPVIGITGNGLPQMIRREHGYAATGFVRSGQRQEGIPLILPIGAGLGQRLHIND